MVSVLYYKLNCLRRKAMFLGRGIKFLAVSQFEYHISIYGYGLSNQGFDRNAINSA